MDTDQIIEIINKNRGKLAGIIIGLIFGWFAITYGFLKAVFVSLCIGAGYYIGRQVDRRADLTEIFLGRFKEK
ncbi:MAG: DUF2273 domain-containing protein [Bacillota bacterium]